MKRLLASRGVSLVELLVAFGILSLIMTAVISFYIEAGAVSAKRNVVSDRLRRFHLGLDKMEQVIREGRIVDIAPYRLTLLTLTDLAEEDGFPNFAPTPLQFVSKPEGVVSIFGEEEKMIMKFEPGERLIFQRLQENPPAPSGKYLISLELYYSGAQDSRSDLLFRRTINLEQYYGTP